MKDCIVSIIIPVYKVEKYLDRCLTSVLSQSYSNLEIILVDDGSPDNCPQMCDEYARRDSRVKVIHKKNGGLSSARNKALDIMAGDYCFFLDSDDFIQAEAIEYLVSLSIKHDADLIQCAFDWGSKDEFTTTPSYKEDVPDVYSGNSIFSSHHNNVTLCGKLFRSYLWKDVRMPVGKLNEDDFTTWKLYYRANTVVVTDLRLYYNFVNDEGISAGLKKVPNINYPMEAYHERISFFDENGETELSILSKWRYSLYLMIAMGADNLRKEDKATLVKEYKLVYKDVLKCKKVPMAHKILLLLTFISPQFVIIARRYNKQKKYK